MARDEPAIAIWETGNELSAPTAWTAAIAAFIRAADPNHLVMGTCHNMSGGSSAPFPKLTLAPYPGPARPQPNLIFRADGNYGIVAAHLDIADIDVVSDHFYPPDLQRFASGVAAAAAAGKGMYPNPNPAHRPEAPANSPELLTRHQPRPNPASTAARTP